MADFYTKTSFSLRVLIPEAALLEECFAVSNMLGTGDNLTDRHPPSGYFLQAFPPVSDDLYSGYVEIFDDHQYPEICADLDISECSISPQHRIIQISSDQAQINTLAFLIQRTSPSALPCGFTWAATCSKPRSGSFSGGYAAIFPDHIDIEASSTMLAIALAE